MPFKSLLACIHREAVGEAHSEGAEAAREEAEEALMARRRGGPRGGINRQGKLWFNGRGTSRGKRAPIRWGRHGDFRSCMRLAKHVPARMRAGFCANRHREAVGTWPGRHGGRRGGKRR